MFKLKKDIYNGLSNKTNTTKVICKYKSDQRFSKNLESALGRNNIFSAVGEIGHARENIIILCETVEWNTNKPINVNNNNNDNNDACGKKNKYESIINDFEEVEDDDSDSKG